MTSQDHISLQDRGSLYISIIRHTLGQMRPCSELSFMLLFFCLHIDVKITLYMHKYTYKSPYTEQ